MYKSRLPQGSLASLTHLITAALGNANRHQVGTGPDYRQVPAQTRPQRQAPDQRFDWKLQVFTEFSYHGDHRRREWDVIDETKLS
tara:strand:- start:474 stop:728 length:255 start_codon:yes stop_codon:yes gene_type:complete